MNRGVREAVEEAARVAVAKGKPVQVKVDNYRGPGAGGGGGKEKKGCVIA